MAADTTRLHDRLPLPWPVLVLVAVAPLLVGFEFGPTGSCGGVLDAVVLPDGRELCTHGADEEPRAAENPGYTTSFALDPATVPAEPVQCLGDGRSGSRVQVLYAYEQGTWDRSAQLDADLRRWVGQAEWTVAASAARTGGRRHVRFVTEATSQGCRLDIESVLLPAGSFNTLNATLTALTDTGHSRDDRKYLVFADVDKGACGTATVPNDDRKGADNRANLVVGYARVDVDCWTTGDRGYYSVAAHELIHTLGGVQRSAPHATDARHCTDEYDVMCYADGAATTTQTVCSDGGGTGEADLANRLLDCGHDDYFHTSPTATSYLGRYWNTADSIFLSGSASAGTPAAQPVRDVAPDPRGRPIAWSGPLASATIPLLPDAHGWETCDLPITVRVAAGTSSDSINGLLGGVSTASSALRDSVRSAVSAVNAGVGVTVLTLDDETWDGSAPADGELAVRFGQVSGRHDVAVTTRDVRIRRAVLTLDGDLASAAGAMRDLFALQGTVRALGVGLTDTLGELTSRYPTARADRTTAMAALRHLYATPCSQDARLDDTVGGARSQRVTAGTRERIDLAGDATTPIAAAVDVAQWLTAQRGVGWADRAVVCRDDLYADCLAGTALGRANGPVLFVPGGPDGTLPAAVRDTLAAALRAGAQVHVLGGPRAVSAGVVSELQRSLPGRFVQRIAGADRYATAAAVAREVVATGGTSATAILSRADDPADAVAAGAAAAERGIPVLLTATGSLPAETQQTLADLGTRTVLIAGGTAAVSDAVESALRSHDHAVGRMAGRDRFETAVEIARAAPLWSRTSVLRSGSVIGLNGRHAQTWSLALAAAPVGAYLDAPVLFTTVDGLPSLSPTVEYAGGTREQLRDLGITGTAPTVRTVFVGAGTWAAGATAEAFHAQALPGFGGNLTVTAS